jgi:hypothetical protein
MVKGFNIASMILVIEIIGIKSPADQLAELPSSPDIKAPKEIMG